MSGIGDYVHYDKLNYILYGINKKGFDKKPDESQALKAQRNRMKIPKNSSISAKNLKRLEQILNAILYKKKKSKYISKKEVERAQARIEEILAKYDNLIPIMWESGGEVERPEFKSARKINTNRKSYVRLSTVQNRLQSMIDNVTKEANKGFISVNTASSLLQQARNFESAFNSLDLEGKRIFKDSEFWKYLDEINNLIEKANFPKTEILENFLLSAISSGMEALSKVDESWADNLVQENLTTVTKTDRASVTFSTGNLNHLSRRVLKGKYNLSENAEGGYDWTFDDRIAKADIVVNFKDGEKSLGISAKNIGVDKIGMVDSTPLLTLLLNQNADFVTHYINIMNYNETSTVALNNQLISDYNNMVKQIAAMKALQGLIGDKQGYSAQILIVNDRVAGQVKVVDMSKIFKNVKKDIDRYFTFQGLDNVRLANSWAGGIAPDGGVNGAMTRISNTLMELHKYKISVSMNRTALYAK